MVRKSDSLVSRGSPCFLLHILLDCRCKPNHPQPVVATSRAFSRYYSGHCKTVRAKYTVTQKVLVVSEVDYWTINSVNVMVIQPFSPFVMFRDID